MQLKTYEDLGVEMDALAGLIRRPEDLFTAEYTPRHFAKTVNREVFNKIAELVAAGTMSFRNLHEAFAGKTFETGEAVQEYLEDLRDIMPSDNAVETARYLKSLADKRSIYSACMEAVDLLDSYKGADVATALTKLVGEATQDASAITQEDIQTQIVDTLQSPKEITPIHGMPKLTELMAGGFVQGYTYGFCGAEKAGKTTLAHSISYGIKHPHLYVALEMGAAQIEQRNIARQAGVNSLAFLEKPEVMIEKTKAYKSPSGVCYLDAPGIHIDDLLYEITKAKHQYGIKGAIIDYWQLITGEQSYGTEEKHLRHVAQSLANYARKNNIWLLVLAQMNKEGQLFGGNGLRKACDMLFMIEHCHEGLPLGRWLRMDASRYTYLKDLGTEQVQGLSLDNVVGPHFRESGY